MKSRAALVAALWLGQLLVCFGLVTVLHIRDQSSFIRYTKTSTELQKEIDGSPPASPVRAGLEQQLRGVQNDFILPLAATGRDTGWAVFALLSSGAFMLLMIWARQSTSGKV